MLFRSKALLDIHPEQVEAFFVLCDPKEKIKTDDNYGAFWASERYVNCLAWIYDKWEATQ